MKLSQSKYEVKALNRIDDIYEIVFELQEEKKDGVSASDIASMLGIDRSNVSKYLNILCTEGRLIKSSGRPVLFKTAQFEERANSKINTFENSLDMMIGAKGSLKSPIQQAKASVIYPPNGLHCLILGETGVGKSMFAELMYRFAIESHIIPSDAPFITFNCSDYAENPNLLISQIFGVKKGAYTGADRDKEGLLFKAHRGFFFLDEIHRLSPQGQEMLFTYIDNGFFRPLGETEKEIRVNVRIIGATTENPDSYLLKTFTRRIPMIINLPPIRERPLIEKYMLIENFLNEEAYRIGKSIYINRNSLISYLLYDCPNNIGQLKSDIQLACAKAFLKYKSEDEDYIIIGQSDLPNHVRKGLLKINEFRKEIDSILNTTSEILKFNNKKLDIPSILSLNTTEDFYCSIEEKYEALKDTGVNDEDINMILSADIESHFKKYMGDIKNYDKLGISSIVDKKIIEITEEIIEVAEKYLDRELDEQIFTGLALHLESSIERIKKGDKIINPKLDSIRSQYQEEFILATKIANIIDKKLYIKVPIDEIGYITMFFTKAFEIRDDKKAPKVAVLIIMHGKSTATSMADVANTLIGEHHAHAIDMPLSMYPETMYELVKEKILAIDEGKGVIILADMGSLTTFGDIISEETDKPVKTIDSVSTPIALEVTRKAVLGYDIDEIVISLSSNMKTFKIDQIESNNKEEVIISACLTGDGASSKIKSIIEKSIDKKEIKVINLNIIDNEDLKDRIKKLKNQYDIIALVSTLNIKNIEIPFISAIDILKGNGIKKINEILKENELYAKVSLSLKEHLNHIDSEELIKDIRSMIIKAQNNLDIELSYDVKMGIAIHIAFLVDNMMAHKETKKFQDLENFVSKHSAEFDTLRKCVKTINEKYHIEIKDNELAFVLKSILNNTNSLYTCV